MRRWSSFLPLVLLSVLASGCSIVRALYIAVVHNSGAPPREELARIDERERELLGTLPSKRVLILPVVILGRTVRYDTATSVAIAAQLRANERGIALAGTDSLVLPFEPQPNELAILWSRFHALAASVSDRPRTDVDYVVLVDVLGAPDHGSVGAVHVMAVTGNGTMAFRRLWNSHQPLYKEIRPHSLDDVVRMVVRGFS
jgi:hypothetical protein